MTDDDFLMLTGYECYIHHNYIHHNQMNGLGYGMTFSHGGGLVEYNLFNYNRHSIAGGDEAYAVEVMDGLEIGIFFWHADDEFPAQIRFFWDENATMYIKYETMHYTLGYLRQLLKSYIE